MLNLRRFRTALTVLAGIAFGSCTVHADNRPIVVELFTSQGCSSCPPADRVLGELAQRPEVLALGYHISYWDHLGWKDPLSSQASTDRQKAYARRLSGRIYTPEMVVEGTSEMIGSNRTEVLAALREVQPLAIAPVSFTKDQRSVIIGPGGGTGDVLLVRFLKHRSTQVAAGENAGRALEDTNGVEALTTLGEWNGAAAAFPLDPPGLGQGLAVLVQGTDGRMLGAAELKADQ